MKPLGEFRWNSEKSAAESHAWGREYPHAGEDRGTLLLIRTQMKELFQRLQESDQVAKLFARQRSFKSGGHQRDARGSQ